MKKKMIEPNKPVGKMTRIYDFLPPPEELIIPEDTVKVTLALKKSNVDFFKHQAERYHTKYQRMIREVVDKYVIQYSPHKRDN